MVRVPVEPANQVPFVPQDGGFKLMLDPLMSSMSAPVVGPVHMSTAARASDGAAEMLESGGPPELASVTAAALGDEAHPTDPQTKVPTVARPATKPKVPSLSLRFMGRSFRLSPGTSNKVFSHPFCASTMSAIGPQISRPDQTPSVGSTIGQDVFPGNAGLPTGPLLVSRPTVPVRFSLLPMVLPIPLAGGASLPRPRPWPRPPGLAPGAGGAAGRPPEPPASAPPRCR